MNGRFGRGFGANTLSSAAAESVTGGIVHNNLPPHHNMRSNISRPAVPTGGFGSLAQAAPAATASTKPVKESNSLSASTVRSADATSERGRKRSRGETDSTHHDDDGTDGGSRSRTRGRSSKDRSSRRSSRASSRERSAHADDDAGSNNSANHDGGASDGTHSNNNRHRSSSVKDRSSSKSHRKSSRRSSSRRSNSASARGDDHDAEHDAERDASAADSASDLGSSRHSSKSAPLDTEQQPLRRAATERSSRDRAAAAHDVASEARTSNGSNVRETERHQGRDTAIASTASTIATDERADADASGNFGVPPPPPKRVPPKVAKSSVVPRVTSSVTGASASVTTGSTATAGSTSAGGNSGMMSVPIPVGAHSKSASAVVAAAVAQNTRDEALRSARYREIEDRDAQRNSRHSNSHTTHDDHDQFDHDQEDAHTRSGSAARMHDGPRARNQYRTAEDERSHHDRRSSSSNHHHHSNSSSSARFEAHADDEVWTAGPVARVKPSAIANKDYDDDDTGRWTASAGPGEPSTARNHSDSRDRYDERTHDSTADSRSFHQRGGDAQSARNNNNQQFGHHENSSRGSIMPGRGAGGRGPALARPNPTGSAAADGTLLLLQSFPLAVAISPCCMLSLFVYPCLVSNQTQMLPGRLCSVVETLCRACTCCTRGKSISSP